MSTELPWSTRAFLMVKLSMSTDITIGSSWEGSIPLKSLSVNVMGGILGRMDTKFTCAVGTSASSKPVGDGVYDLATSSGIVSGGSSLLSCRSQRWSSSRGPRGVWSLLLGVSSLHGERLVVRLLRTKWRRCPAWIRSSILSFKA